MRLAAAPWPDRQDPGDVLILGKGGRRGRATLKAIESALQMETA